MPSLRGALLGALTAVGVPLFAATPALAAPVNIMSPTITAPDRTVGQDATCNPGTWDSTSYDFSYEFLRDAGTPAEVVDQPFGFFSNVYTLQPADGGHPVSCVERATDFSVAPAVSTDAASSNAITVVNPPSVLITRYTPAIRGSEGGPPAGTTTVTVSLSRRDQTGADRVVATGSTPVGADGSWSTTLVPTATTPASRTHAPALFSDVVRVHYAGTGVPPDQRVTGDSLAPLDSATLSADGSHADVPAEFGEACSDVTFILDGGAPLPTTFTPGEFGGTCRRAFAPALTDQAHLQVRVGGIGGFPGAAGVVTGIEDVGLRGVAPVDGQGNGPPTCEGDLVDASVACSNLSGATFTVSRNGGAAIVLNAEGQASVPGLVAGNVIVLKEQGLARAISTLHVDPLRVELQDFFLGGSSEATGGVCSPNKWLDFGGALCSTTGTLAGLVQFGEGSGSFNESYDDTSGGGTTLDLAQIFNTIPIDSESIGGTFVAYADVAGPTPTSVVLTIFHRLAGGGDGTQVGAAVTINPATGGVVAGLALGRYNAHWLLTDSHGDKRTLHSQFAVQPGAGGTPGPRGPAGPQGPQGAAGPRGPAGIGVSGVKCKGKLGKHKKVKITCKVKTTAPLNGHIAVFVTRGHTVYAHGARSVHGRRLTVRASATRAMTRGRYRAELVLSRKGAARTLHVRIRLR